MIDINGVKWPPRAMKGESSVSLSDGYEVLPLSEEEAAVWNRCLDECQKSVKEFTDQANQAELAARRFQSQFDDGDEE